LRGLSEAGLQRLRGEHISMVFQEPMTSLNPVRTVGSQVAEVLLAHEDQSDLTARARAVRMLERVGIPDPTGRFDDFPHQMSGGMRQRVMIAASLICSPRVLILDEPTTALDVTVQAQILDLVRDLQREFDMSILFITHDLGVIAEVADRIAVMYAGRIVEIGEAAPVLARPQHPYTEGLLRSAPRLGMHLGDVQILRGAMPNPLDLPSGCRFEPRCEYAFGRCAQEPPLIETETGCAACWLRDDRSKTTAPVVV